MNSATKWQRATREKKRFRRTRRSGSKRKSFKDEESLMKIRNYSLSRTEAHESKTSFQMDSEENYSTTDTDSEPDRSNPLWRMASFEKRNLYEESKSSVSSTPEIKKMPLWDEIMLEYEDKRLEFDNLKELEKPFEPPLPVYAKLSPIQYLDKYIFPILCPALEETLHKAKEWECLLIQKCVFSGLDYLAELLWNRNPLHPRRHLKHREIFDIPFATVWLHYNPRPIYPLSWLWSKEQAIIVLQSYIRQYLVCKEAECSEMRQFWKVLKIERDEKRWRDKQIYIEELEEMFNEILDQLVMVSVFDAEWKVHGCHCVQKPCQCVCKCMKWCKCCKCYKIPDSTKNTSEAFTMF